MCLAESNAEDALLREAMRKGTTQLMTPSSKKRARKKLRDQRHLMPCSGLGSHTPTVVVNKDT